MANSNKLKILCLHGYRQNSQSFREKTGAFRKIPIVKKNTELVFIDAPNRVPPINGGDESTENSAGSIVEDQRGWWFLQPNNQCMAQGYTDTDLEFKESLEVIKQAFTEQGPFDGVFAFSQGASMLSILCAMREKDPENVLQFDFVILVAGFKSRHSSRQCFYEIPVTIPSLHMFGDTDKVIDKEMSEELLQLYPSGKVINHPGGHFIPATGAQKQEFTAFFNDMLQLKQLKSLP